MPVTTDACLFGALVKITPGNWLDIGTGTGLLALMLAQRCKTATVTAIEPDAKSCADAEINFHTSPWVDRLRLIQTELQKFHSVDLFDGIICNPPFFENQLPSPDVRKNSARHTATLSFTDLISAICTLLKKDGTAWLLIPELHRQNFTDLALMHNLQLIEMIAIKAFPHSAPHVCVLAFSRRDEFSSSEFVTYTEKGMYSAEAVDLMKPFYLKL